MQIKRLSRFMRAQICAAAGLQKPNGEIGFVLMARMVFALPRISIAAVSSLVKDVMSRR